MKKLTCTALFVSLLLSGSVLAQFTSSIVYDRTMQEFLHRIDLFENYGNKEKLLDSKRQLVKFQHLHEDGTTTHKMFKLEIVGPKEDVIEFHVTYQKQEGEDENENDQQLDFEKALTSFIGFRLPRDHPRAGNWGRRYTYRFDSQEQNENDQEVIAETSTPVRFSIDDETGELKRIDIMSFSLTTEGFVGKIKPLNPEQPIRMYSMSTKEHRELAEQLLKKHAIPAPQTPDEPIGVDDSGENS
ncbi:MAG: hypothetical protein F4Z01_06290 [Gammaproteobacteria bacterium]|nr:hypothetical protein [Gammaproteobacteria bacterium]MYF37611.1 hypothetical protein [Gammaproteobacteria bacterium]